MVSTLQRILIALLLGSITASACALGLSFNPPSVMGGAPITATITLDEPAAAGGVTASLTSNNPAATVPATVSIPAGQQFATFQITTVRVDSPIQATVTATVSGVAVSNNLTVNAVSLAGFSVSPGSIVGGLPCTGTIILTSPAGVGGVNILLAATGSAITIPGKVSVAAGQLNATFPIQTKRLSKKEDVVITATLGLVSTTANMAVFPEGPLSITLSPGALNGGDPSVGTVVLTGPAPAGGLVINLTANNKNITIPESVKVEAAATSATFSIKTIKVWTLESVLIAAKYHDQTQMATLAVNPLGISTIVLNPTSVVGSVPSGGTITLVEPAPPGGLKIVMSSDQLSATVQPLIVIPAGKKTASFTIKTLGVAAPVVANIKAVVGNVPKQVPLSIAPPALVSLVLGSPAVDGGDSSSATVTIGSPAPPAGLDIVIACNQKTASAPVKVNIEAGHTSASFRIRTTKVTAQTQVVISATFLSTTQTATLTIN